MGSEVEFFSALASLIPVLVLAAVIELRGISEMDAHTLRGNPTKLRSESWFTLGITCFFIATASVGEFASLQAVLDGPGKWSAEAAALAVVSLFFVVTLGVLNPIFQNLENPDGGSAHLVGRVITGLVFAAAAIAICIAVP